MAYNTGNAVPSKDPRDLLDNAESFDIRVTSRTERSTLDRLGVPRKTWHGIEQDFAEFLVASGFEPVHLTYQAGVGLQVDRPTQLIDYSGSVYRVKMPASFPVVLSGTWATDSSLLVDVGDQSLRLDLAGQDSPLKGAGMIGYLGRALPEHLAEESSRISAIEERASGVGAVDFLAGEGRAFQLSRSGSTINSVASKRIVSGKYDHFGQMDQLPTGELCLFYRSGVSHEADSAPIVFTKLLPNGQWAERQVIAQDPVYDLRDPSGGVMPNGRVVVATVARELSTTNFPETRIYVSDDYGITWTLQQTLYAPAGKHRFTFGKGFAIGTKYYIPYYTNIGAPRQLRLLETGDGGDTWAEGPVVYSGDVDYNETGYASLGGGAVLAVSRIAGGSGGQLRQFLSTDGGVNWADQGGIPATPGAEASVLVAPSLAVITSESGTVHVVMFYTDRTTDQMVYRTIPRSLAMSGVTGWSERIGVYSAPNLSGYQSHVVAGAGRILGNLFRETTYDAIAEAYQWEVQLGSLPDYQSDWSEVSGSTQYTFEHGLQRPPRRVEVDFSTSPTSGMAYRVLPTYFNDGTNKGSGAQVAVSSSAIVVGTGAAVWGTGYFGGIDASVSARVASGYYRVRAWL
jgi:hypothetical protein